MYFDKRCPCFSVTWDNATCHEDKLLSTTWEIPADLRPTDASKIVNVTGREQMVLDSLFKIESCKYRILTGPSRDNSNNFREFYNPTI